MEYEWQDRGLRRPICTVTHDDISLQRTNSTNMTKKKTPLSPTAAKKGKDGRTRLRPGLHIYKDKKNEFRVTITGMNGQVLVPAESYTRKANTHKLLLALAGVLGKAVTNGVINKEFLHDHTKEG